MTPAEVLALRQRLGLTRPQFARLLGVVASTVFRWESGERNVSGDPAAEMRRLMRGAR